MKNWVQVEFAVLVRVDRWNERVGNGKCINRFACMEDNYLQSLQVLGQSFLKLGILPQKYRLPAQ